MKSQVGLINNLVIYETNQFLSFMDVINFGVDQCDSILKKEGGG